MPHKTWLAPDVSCIVGESKDKSTLCIPVYCFVYFVYICVYKCFMLDSVDNNSLYWSMQCAATNFMALK